MMFAGIGPKGEVLGYFLEQQLKGLDALEVMKTKFALTNATSVIAIDEETHRSAMLLGRPHYALNGKLVPRPAMTPTADSYTIRANGSDPVEIKNLPANTTITVDGATQPLGHDGDPTELYFTAMTPGTFFVALEAWPFMPRHFTVIAR